MQIKETSNPEQIKKRIRLTDVFKHFGSQESKGRWHCLCPENHTNGDATPSVTIRNERAWCWSQKCFVSADVFEVVGRMEHLSSFGEKVRRVQELFMR